MKANMSQLYKRNKKGELKPTWRYWLGYIFGSLEGIDDCSDHVCQREPDYDKMDRTFLKEAKRMGIPEEAKDG